MHIPIVGRSISRRFVIICSSMDKDKYHQHPWTTLGMLKRSHLSEYEVYLAWVMKSHRESVAVRQIPYVNWGRADEASLGVAKSYGAAYLTNHDEWNPKQICCVNSQWPSGSKDVLRDMGVRGGCRYCSAYKGDVKRINCDVLGIDGCKDVRVVSFPAMRYMVFKDNNSTNSGR